MQCKWSMVFFSWSVITLQYFISFCCTTKWNSYQFSSVAQSCPTLCDPMNCSTPGLPVHHQLPYVYIDPLPLEPPCPHSIPWVSTEHRAEAPVLHSSFPLAVYFTHGSVFMSNLTSQLSYVHCPCIVPLPYKRKQVHYIRIENISKKIKEYFLFY